MTREEIIEIIKNKPHIIEYESLFMTNIFGQAIQRPNKDVVVDENGFDFMIIEKLTTSEDSLLSTILPNNNNFSKQITPQSNNNDSNWANDAIAQHKATFFDEPVPENTINKNLGDSIMEYDQQNGINSNLGNWYKPIQDKIDAEKKIKEEDLKNEKKEIKTAKIKREIYLTFDDGLEQGTEEILELLKEKGVKATFFLIGKRVESMYNRDKKLCFKLLKDIYENHSIGNHSYSHANESYNSYYREGGVIFKVVDGKQFRRDVVTDFVKSRNTILYYLELAKGKSNPLQDGYSDTLLKSKNQKKSLARFPGTNTWFIKDKIIDIKYTNRLSNLDLPKQDTKEEAETIGKTYSIFGWDYEWRMQNPKSNNLIKKTIQEKIDNKTIRYDNIEDTDPFFDLYKKEYIDFDRPVQSVEEVKDELLDLVYESAVPFDNKTKANGKVVLLMHDRQFRKGKLNSKKEVDLNDKTTLKKLGELIDYFKSIKSDFKTLDTY